MSKKSARIEVNASFCEIINEDLLRVFLGKIPLAAVGFDLTAGEVGHGVRLMRGWLVLARLSPFSLLVC